MLSTTFPVLLSALSWVAGSVIDMDVSRQWELLGYGLLWEPHCNVLLRTTTG